MNTPKKIEIELQLILDSLYSLDEVLDFIPKSHPMYNYINTIIEKLINVYVEVENIE